MYTVIKNENYGHTVATYGDYVVVANPTSLRWDYASASALRTGSVDYFRYNKNTDQHDYIGTMFKQLETVVVMLAAETGSPTPPPISGSLETATIRTETPGTILSTRNRDLDIDKNNYTASVEDAFGWSLDMYEKLLVIGSPYFYQLVSTSASMITASGASVEVHNLATTELGSTQSCFVQSLYNPHTDITESFGRGVSINSSWIAVGSPEVSSSKGAVYMYRNTTTGSVYSWSFHQVIDAPLDVITEGRFGWDLKLNKQTGSFSQSLVVGCGNNSNAKAYYYEIITGSWVRTHTFTPTIDWKPLTFGNYMPYDMDGDSVMNTTNGYGRAVSTYDSTVVIGAPYDRTVYEFSGSSMYQQGSTYVYERCPNDIVMVDIPRTPNAEIGWTVSNPRVLAPAFPTASLPEAHSHGTLKLNGKLYACGWDGYYYVVNDPDNSLGNITYTSSIMLCATGPRNLTSLCYSSTTGYLYALAAGDWNFSLPASTPSTASVIKIDPNDLSQQTLLYDGIPNNNLFYAGTVGYGIPPICAYGNYVYFASANYPSSIYKVDATTGALVASTPWVSASVAINGAHSIVMDDTGTYFYVAAPSGHIARVSTADLSYITKLCFGDFPGGPFSFNFTDDIAYRDGYVYGAYESGGGNIIKIDGITLDYTTAPAMKGSYGAFADEDNVYLLQSEEIWVYPDGNIADGPVRFGVSISPVAGNVPNEIWVTDGGNLVYSNWHDYSLRATRLDLQWRKPVSYFDLNLKTYGTPLTLKNNRMGYSVDVFDGYALSGIPKTNMDTMTSCYVGSTLDQAHQCEADLEHALSGQAMLLQKNTSSMDWEIVNVYQRKKKYLSPYRVFGYDVSIDERSMVVGAPLLLSDSGRQINLNTTSSSGVTLDDITGKAYIYNLANLRPEFHVGNVFYRNGKIVVMTSGSVFDGLFYNPLNTATYEYDLQFKGQHTIFEKQIICTVSPGEFNVSTNPTAYHHRTGSLDVNRNEVFDFQDADVLLRYMQYKNTSTLGLTVSTDWSSSVIKTDDERSLYNWNISQSSYSPTQTSQMTSESIVRWETVDTWMQDVLDFNEDNKIDVRDMSILWKYFSNRLTQANYTTYITPSCKKKLFSDVMDYLNFISQKNAVPEINHEFQDYERMTTLDKTGSFVAPMVTTIGLYSGLDLAAVAKLGSPIKITPELPINFVVKMDY